MLERSPYSRANGRASGKHCHRSPQRRSNLTDCGKTHRVRPTSTDFASDPQNVARWNFLATPNPFGLETRDLGSRRSHWPARPVVRENGKAAIGSTHAKCMFALIRLGSAQGRL